MAPLLHDLPVFYNEDAVCMLDSAEAVRNDDARTACHEFDESILNVSFRNAVETACCFIEDENGTIRQKCARDGDPLAFSATQLDAAFPDKRGVSERE